ncbi:MAG: hypothetical protein OHK0022_46910 [Roseiflexaceae bacterium]
MNPATPPPLVLRAAVLDDLTPQEYWPESWRGQPDTTREFWLRSPRLAATEIRVAERHAVILATRIA